MSNCHFDYVAAHPANITLILGSDLYRVLFNSKWGYLHGEAIRTIIHKFFLGEVKVGTRPTNIEKVPEDDEDPFRYKVYSSTSKAAHRTIKTCASKFDKQMSSVIRSILREEAFGYTNPYREFLLELYEHKEKKTAL